MPRRRRRSGIALLEAIAALAILSMAGLAGLELVRSSARVVVATQATDMEIARASAFLDAVSMWSVNDLDRSMGTRDASGWQLRVSKTDALYRVQLRDSLGKRVLLETTLFRRSRAPELNP